MLGLKLFIHAFKMLFHDIWVTVRITLFPLIIGYGLAYAVMYLVTGYGYSGDLVGQVLLTGFSGTFYLGFLAALAILAFTFCWSAVGWHRFALLNEQPKAYLPVLNTPLIKAYFGAGVKLFLAMIAVAIPAMLLLFLIVRVTDGSATARLVVFSIYGVLLSVLALRLALVLPAASLGKPIGLRTSWEATGGIFAALVVVTIASNGLGSLAGVFGNSAIGMVLGFFLSWLSFALGISVLTTLYGYCIEKRALD